MSVLIHTPNINPGLRVITAETPAFARIVSPRERKRAQAGKWIYSPLGLCDSAVFNPEPNGLGVGLAGGLAAEWMLDAVCALLEATGDIGIAIVAEDAGPTLGFLCPNERIARKLDKVVAASKAKFEVAA